MALSDAQHRLLGANDRLWSGLDPDVLGLGCGEVRRLAAGEGAIAERIVDAAGGGDGTDVETAMLGALERVHWTIGRAFIDYQRAYEERRRLAVDVGELSAQLIEVLCAAGWSRGGCTDRRRARAGDRRGAMIARCRVPSWGVSRIPPQCAMTIAPEPDPDAPQRATDGAAGLENDRQPPHRGELRLVSGRRDDPHASAPAAAVCAPAGGESCERCERPWKAAAAGGAGAA